MGTGMRYSVSWKFMATAGALCGIAAAGCAHFESPADDGSVRPDGVAFGLRVDETLERLEEHCAATSVRDVDVALPGFTRQAQIDCEGFSYFGAPRKAELVFGDDRLVIVWILTEKSEELALERAFRQEFGAPSHVTPAFTAFADDRAAVRKDIPEALFYAEEVAQPFRGWFDSEAGT